MALISALVFSVAFHGGGNISASAGGRGDDELVFKMSLSFAKMKVNGMFASEVRWY